MKPINLEVQFYLSDPDHKTLNECITRIRDPKKRQMALKIIEAASSVSPRLEEIRQDVIATKVVS